MARASVIRYLTILYYSFKPNINPENCSQVHIDVFCLKTSLCTCTTSVQLCPTLCKPMDCSPPGSSVHGVLQARILEWVAMPSSRGSYPPRDQTQVSYVSCTGKRVLYHQCHLGSPRTTKIESK